jgi:hypothetical protein
MPSLSEAAPFGRFLTAGARLKFLSKITVDASTGCWLWTKYVGPHGYGMINVPASESDKTIQYAHRYSYAATYGAIPSGLDLDHLCRRRTCVNPAHLEAVTRRENLLRGNTLTAAKVAQTHCSNGHPLSGENLYVNPASGSRNCRTCRTELYRAWVDKNRERRREIDRAFGRAKTIRKRQQREGRI